MISICYKQHLFLIWVGFLGIRFVEGVITPCLKLVRIMLETSNLACTHICSLTKYTH